MRLELTAFLLIATTSVPALGAWDVRADVAERRDYLALSGDMSTFTVEGGAIQGTGAKVDFTHYFGRKVGIELFLASAVNASKSVSASFTGYGGYVTYVPFGNCCSENRTVNVEGRSLLTEKAEGRNVFEIGLGLNQYLLNGSKGVYSASGLGLMADYRFSAFSFEWKIAGRYAQMVSASVQIQVVFFSFGLALPL